MKTQADSIQEDKSQSSSHGKFESQGGGESTFQFVDNRSEAIVQRKLQELANNSPHAKKIAQLQAMADNQSAQQQPIQKKENNTGLPNNLKIGVENLSGISLDDIKVHRNSDKPAQLQAHAYAQGTDIHLGAGQEKHLPHEAWHVIQQKQGRVKPTLQMKGGVLVNDETGLEKEADVMGQKAQSVGKTTDKGSEVGVAQLQAKSYSQNSAAQLPVVQREVKKEDKVSKDAENSVTEEQIEEVRKRKGMSLEEIQEETKLTLTQITTAQARLFGDVKLEKKEDGVSVLKPASTWDKWLIDKLSEEDKAKVVAAKAKIPRPEEIFTQDAIAKHLGEFADGAHAFVDPDTSGKIIGDIKDPNFKGWGADANFVAPLGEAEALHQQALKGRGIITLEDELSIGKCNWSRSDWNPNKEMVRWTIPKPLDFKLENNKPFLSMATGNETGALVKEWVAGGFTLGGMTEAVVQAIPRFKLLKSLAVAQIKMKTVHYVNTPDNIGEKGPGTLDPKSKFYKNPKE